MDPSDLMYTYQLQAPQLTLQMQHCARSHATSQLPTLTTSLLLEFLRVQLGILEIGQREAQDGGNARQLV